MLLEVREERLALIGEHPDGKCEALLVHCRKYSRQRRKLLRDLGATGETIFSTPTLVNLDSWNKIKYRVPTHMLTAVSMYFSAAAGLYCVASVY